MSLLTLPRTGNQGLTRNERTRAGDFWSLRLRQKVSTSNLDSELDSLGVVIHFSPLAEFYVRVLRRIPIKIWNMRFGHGVGYKTFGGQIFIPDIMISVVRQYDGTVKSISG